jgi:hypothetical protein
MSYSLAPGLSAKQKFKRSDEIMATELQRLERKDTLRRLSRLYRLRDSMDRPGRHRVLNAVGKAVATGTMERPIPLTVQRNETFDVAADTDTTAGRPGFPGTVPLRRQGGLERDAPIIT